MGVLGMAVGRAMSLLGVVREEMRGDWNSLAERMRAIWDRGAVGMRAVW